MPDSEPELTSEQHKLITKWIENKWKNRKCECCGEDAWTVEDHLGAVPSIDIGGFAAPYSYVYVLVICDNCGNTRFVNAVSIGLLDEVGGRSDG